MTTLTVVLIFTIITILLVTTNIVIYKALTVQLEKIKKYEDIILEHYEWIYSVREASKNTYLKMKSLDEKNLFFKDDDVGFLFQELLDLTKKLNDKIQQ